MIPPSQEEVFQTITSHLQEHKIITFKWLSRNLKVHSILAKEYLEQWIRQSPKDQYIISYTVFGRKDSGELLLMLTTEITDDYFHGKNIIVIEKHMYSIQLSDSFFEPSFIYNVDKSTYELQQMSLSSINYCTEIMRKSPEARRASATLNGNNEGYAKHSRNNIFRVSPKKKNIDLVEEDDVPQISLQKNEHPRSNGACRTSPRKNMSEVGSQTVLKNQSTDEMNKIQQISSKRSKTNKPVVAITNFFGRSRRKEENESKEPGPENLNETKINLGANVEVENVDNSSSDDNKKDSKKGSAIKIQERVRKNQKSDLTKTKKTKKKGKQMKRILKPLDSDSDEDSDNSDTSINNNEIFETEQELVVAKELVLEPRVIVLGGKKRKRKVIEEEGEEDGFMVTTKKVIYESCDSEDESEEFSIKEKVAQPITITSSQPEKKPKTELLTKKKQSSILNFLQKPKT